MDGLRAAYNSPNGISLSPDQKTVYVSGTHTFRDVLDDLLIPFSQTEHSERYGQLEDELSSLDVKPKTLVGHSLGGSVVLDYASRHKGFRTRTYGAPVVSNSKGARWGDRWDPISAFDRGAHTTYSWPPHLLPS